jgi:hypothetical protein
MVTSTTRSQRALLSLSLAAAVSLTAAVTAQNPQLPPRDSVQSSQSASGTGRITGLVVAVDNGAPVKRARIQLSGAAFATARATATPGDGVASLTLSGGPVTRMQLEAECDPTGHFEFTGVPAGRYSLYAAAQAGFVNSSRTETLELKDGATETVLIRLERTAVISGRIVDEYGDPVVRAQVRALRRSPFGGPPAMSASAMTDDLGQYRLFDLRPGLYQVSALSSNVPLGGTQNARPRSGLVPTYYPGVASADLAGTIPVKAAQEVPASFSLVRATLGCVRGTAVDSTGGSLGRAGGGSTVSLQPRSAQEVGITRGVQVQPDSAFSICDVPPGDYYLVTNSYRNAGPTAGATPINEGAYMPVSVTGDELRADIQTNVGATISGRIVVEGATAPASLTAAQGGPAGGVAGSSGTPGSPSRGSVMIRSAGGTYLANARPAAVQDDGTFELTGVRGQVLLTASLNGQAATLKAVLRGMEDITTTPIELWGTERIGDVTIVLTRDTGKLQGMVTNGRGDPAPDAVVLLFPDDPKRCMNGSPFVRQGRSLGQAAVLGTEMVTAAVPGGSAPTSSPRVPGQVQMNAVVPGHYLVVAFDPGNEPTPTTDSAVLERLRPLATSVEIKAGDTANVELKLAKLDSVIGG